MVRSLAVEPAKRRSIVAIARATAFHAVGGRVSGIGRNYLSRRTAAVAFETCARATMLARSYRSEFGDQHRFHRNASLRARARLGGGNVFSILGIWVLPRPLQIAVGAYLVACLLQHRLLFDFRLLIKTSNTDQPRK